MTTPRAARAARLAASALVAAGSLIGGQPRPPAAAQEPPTEVRLQLASQTSWVTPDGEFALRLRVDGRTAGVDLRVEVHSRLTSRSAFALTLTGEALGGTVETTEAPLADLGRDPTGAVQVRLRVRDGDAPDPPDAIRLTQAGVYPIVVEARRDGSVVGSLVTHLVRVPPGDEDAAPLEVAVVLPVGAPPALNSFGEAELEEGAADAVGAVVRALADHEDVPATVAPVPETLDALADGGPDERELLGSLRRSLDGRQLLAGPYVKIDVPAFVAAGLDDETTAQFTRGADTLADLLRERPDGRTYVADQGLTPASQARLRDLGIDQLVVPDGALQPITDRSITLTEPFEMQGEEGRRQRAIAADAGLSAHFDEDDPVLAAHRLLADLAVVFFDLPGREARGVTVVAPEEWEPSSRLLDSLLRGLDVSPILEPVVVDDLLADVAPALGPDELPLVRALQLNSAPGDDLTDLAPDVRDIRARLIGYRSMTGPAHPRFQELERRLLVAEASGLDDDTRREHLSGIRNDLAEEISAVRAPSRQTVTLTSREGEIPLSFRNDAGYPVRVTVTLESDKLEFPDGSIREFTFPQGNTSTSFRVRARTSGAFPLRVTVKAPDCCLELGGTRLTVRSTAVSGVAAFLSIGAAAFLLVWWLAHFRSVRRARRLVGAD